MVIFVVIFAIFFCGIKKKMAIRIFSQNLHLLSFPTIYSLPCFPLKWRTYEFFPGGHGRTPAKVQSNLNPLEPVKSCMQSCLQLEQSGT